MSARRPATIAQAGERRSARIESLRALAALGVLVGHVFGQSRGYQPRHTLDTLLHRAVFGGGFGVFVFFALTGYLLFLPFARAGRDGGRIDLRGYAVNRVLRILPLYAFAVVLLLLLSGAGASQWWRFLTFSENFSTRTVGTVDGPMWSLVVEVHFYLLLPLLAWALTRLARRSGAGAVGLLLALGALSWALREHAVGGDARRILLEYSLPATFMYFVPGMLLALLALEWEGGAPGWLRGGLERADVWLLAAAAVTLAQFQDYGNSVLIAIAAFLAVGACVLPLRPGRLLAALDWRPLAILGVASYSLYIWHAPIVTGLGSGSGLPHGFGAQLAIAGIPSLAAALVSYRLIEAPFLRLRRRWARPSRMPAPAPSGAGAGLGAGPGPETVGSR